MPQAPLNASMPPRLPEFSEIQKPLPVTPPPVNVMSARPTPVASMFSSVSIDLHSPSASMETTVEKTVEMHIEKRIELDRIDPSASSMIELEAQVDALSSDEMKKSMDAAEEDLPRPLSAASKGLGVSMDSAAVAPRMSQVEMFEDKTSVTAVPKDESIGIRSKDLRAESLARAQQIARSLGVTNLTDDEYDIPTFIRRQQQNSSINN